MFIFRSSTIGRRIVGTSSVAAVTMMLVVGTSAEASDSAVPAEATGWEVRDADQAEIQTRAVKYPKEGGKWSYGTTRSDGGGTVYSDYLHQRVDHGSSVKNAHGRTSRSPVARPGQWSHAELPAIAGEKDEAFYWTL